MSPHGSRSHTDPGASGTPPQPGFPGCSCPSSVPTSPAVGTPRVCGGPTGCSGAISTAQL